MSHHRLLAVVLSATVLTGALSFGAVAEASPRPSRGCATHAEVEKQLRDGMTPQRVRKVIGAGGKITERNRTAMMIEFKPCNPRTHSEAYVQFERNKPSKPFRVWDFGFYWSVS